jgi:hypothetical protein
VPEKPLILLSLVEDSSAIELAIIHAPNVFISVPQSDNVCAILFVVFELATYYNWILIILVEFLLFVEDEAKACLDFIMQSSQVECFVGFDHPKYPALFE